MLCPRDRASHLPDRRDRGRKRQSVRFISVAAREVMILEIRRNLAASGTQSKRRVGRSDAFRGYQSVRLQPLAGSFQVKRISLLGIATARRSIELTQRCSAA